VLRIAGLIVLLVLVVLTIRTAWTWNYINYDSALEFGVYAHGGPGVKIALKEIQELSQRTVGGNQIQIRYDADASWPWVWYLRDFPNKTQISNSPSRSDLDAPIILGSGKNWNAMDAVLRVTHTQVQYHRIWWPMEDYKTFVECPTQETGPDGRPVFINAYDENGDGKIDAVEQAQGDARCRERNVSILWNWFVADSQKRTALLDIFLNRDYALYDQIRTASQAPNAAPITHTPDNWPLIDDFRLYVKRDLQAQIWSQSIGGVSAPAAASVDPYIVGFKNVAPVQVWGGAVGNGPGQMTAPHGIAVAPDGSIYVADSLNHRVVKFDKQGQFIASFGGPNADTQPGQFKEPWGVAVASDNTLYVADTWNNRMQKFTPDGAMIQVWGVNADTGGTAVGSEGGFYGQRGVAVDATGRVIVADTGNKRVQIFDADGKFVSQFGGGGLQPGQLDEPVGIAADPKGNIVVADTWNGRVQVFDSSGQPITSWDINGWLDKDNVGKPYLAVDQQQRVYVADGIGRRILVFDITGKYLGSFGQYATDATGFSLPSGIAVDKEGYIYVVDTDTARILKYPPFQP
jgi:sugar lactone lactonase YvrE